MFKDYYQILEVPRDASQPEIKRSYRKLAKVHHPDSNLQQGEDSQFLLINEAYQILSDQASRESYNNRYDKIAQIRRSTKKQASVFSEAYSDPYKEPFQDTYTPPVQEEPVAEPFNFEQNYQQREKTYTPPQTDFNYGPQTAPKPAVKNYPKSLLWLAKIVAGLSFVFAISICADYFMAEASEVQTMIEARLTTGPDEKVSCTIKTDKSEFPIAYQKYGFLGKGDELILYTTPLYKVMSSIQIINGEKIWPHYGIYNSFSIFLFLLIGCTIAGLFMRKPEYIVRFGVANILLVMLTALILLRS